jgi:hypothetical protein
VDFEKVNTGAVIGVTGAVFFSSIEYLMPPTTALRIDDSPLPASGGNRAYHAVLVLDVILVILSTCGTSSWPVFANSDTTKTP